MSKPILFTPKDFLADFLHEVSTAKKSIYLQSMNFESGEVLGKIEKVLIQALDRNVRVNITHDWVAQVFVKGSLPLLPTVSPKSRKYHHDLNIRTQEMADRLRAKGATIIITNRPNVVLRYIPMLGRNHIKLYLVDEKIAWVGGVNLFDSAFERQDLMVRFEDPEALEKLHKQFFMVNELRAIKDYQVKLTDTETLFVDTGKKGRSLIYSEAMAQIDKAESHIVFMSQFLPDGPLLRKLIAAAKRGVKVDVFTSNGASVLFTKYPTRAAFMYFKFAIKRHPLITLAHQPTLVHAKLLIIDDKCGLFGSHNYSYSGVAFGTEEIMVETTNSFLVEQLQKFVS